MTLEMTPLVHPRRSLFLSSPLKTFISWISWRNTCSVHMLERLPVSFSSIKEMDNTSKQSLVTTQSLSMTVCQSLNWNTEERKFRGWILTEALWPRAVWENPSVPEEWGSWNPPVWLFFIFFKSFYCPNIWAYSPCWAFPLTDCRTSYNPQGLSLLLGNPANW